MKNADKDEKPSGSVSSQMSELGFPEDEDDAHPEGKNFLFTIVISVDINVFCCWYTYVYKHTFNGPFWDYLGKPVPER